MAFYPNDLSLSSSPADGAARETELIDRLTKQVAHALATRRHVMQIKQSPRSRLWPEHFRRLLDRLLG